MKLFLLSIVINSNNQQIRQNQCIIRIGVVNCIEICLYIIHRIDSSKFKIKEGHENNLRNPFPKRDVVPRYVDAGAFHISYAFIDNLV